MDNIQNTLLLGNRYQVLLSGVSTYALPSKRRCKNSLLRDAMFTNCCIMIGVGVCDVTRENAEFMWPLLPAVPSTSQYKQVIIKYFFLELIEDSTAGCSKTQLLPNFACMSIHALSNVLTDISAVVFGQHIHLTLILVTVPSVVLWKAKFTTVNLSQKN
jgi:hypothetical protein